MMTDYHYYNLGYYKAADDVYHWLNSYDSQDKTVSELRSDLVTKLMEMRPPYRK